MAGYSQATPGIMIWLDFDVNSYFLVLSKMAKVGMRHRESFNELVGNLSRDAVKITHPNRMALLAMNNKIFSDGLENHLESQQPTQNPTQQVYNPPPPQTAPYVPAAAASAAAPADGPPSWMQAGARMGLGALTGLAKTGVAAAKVIHASYQAQEAARQAAQATAIMDGDFDDDFLSVAGGSDSMAIEDAQHFHEMQMQNHARDIEEARARSQRDAIAMVEDTHQRNPFDDGGATLALMGRDTTASAVQLMQFAIEDQRPTFQHDGLDLITPALPSSSWMELPYPPPPPPALFDFKGQTSDEKLDEMIAKHIAEKQARKAARDAAKTTKVRSKYGTTTYPAAAPVNGDKRTKPQFSTDQSRPKKTKTAPPAEQDTTQYRKPRKVPGQTSDEKIEHLLRQRVAGVGQLPSETTNPFAGVFDPRN